MPNGILDSLRVASDSTADVAVEFARKLLDEVSGIISGVYHMQQFDRYDKVFNIVAGSR